MTILADAIRRHADHVPDRIAIDGGAHGQYSWRVLAHALDAAIADAQNLRGPLAIQLDQGLSLCMQDLALLEAGVAWAAIPAFFTEDQRKHVLDTIQSSPREAAKISFTSGSTGMPKPICLSADHLLSVAQSVVDHVGDRHAGRHLPLLPPGILLENVAGFYATLLAGGTYVALPQAEVGMAEPFRPDFLRMAQVIADQKITSLILVPEYLEGLLTVLEHSQRRLPDLTLVAVGGARTSLGLLERAAAVGLPVRQGYGMTECGSVVTLEEPGESKRGSVGSSIGFNRIRIADDGEILIEGPHALDIPDGPFATGDIGRIDADGRLWIEGRKSNLIVTAHGRNVSPEWVEGALLAQPAIAQAMVHGDGKRALSAFIVPSRPDADIRAAVAGANASLPAYAKILHWQRTPPFTPANGKLTGNGRLRRAAIMSAHFNGD